MKPLETLNLFCYLWKHNNWILDSRSRFGRFKEVEINLSIFLLSVQGGRQPLFPNIFGVCDKNFQFL